MFDEVRFSLSDVATAVSVVVAIALGGFSIWQHHSAERLRRSHNDLSAAIRRLEQAFREFELRRSEEWAGLPEPDRLLWLSVARMLREAESLSTKVSEPSHQVLYSQARSYWRGKFYDLLQPLGRIPLTYFADSPDKAHVQFEGDRAPISPKSLKVLRDFTVWPKEQPDPLAGIEGFDAGEVEMMKIFGWRSVGDYIEALDAVQSGSESRSAYWRKQWNLPRD